MLSLLSVAVALLGLVASKAAAVTVSDSKLAPSASDANAKFYAELDKMIAERSTLARNSKIQCPVGYVPSTSEDTCHYFSPPTVCVNSWFYAKVACETVGGHLASVETSEEDAYLRDTLRRVYTTAENWHSWIGGTCLRSVNQFRWAHNDSLVKYFGWYTGQPNNAGGAEHCIAMRRDWSYAWDDVNCVSFACRYICEYP